MCVHSAKLYGKVLIRFLMRFFEYKCKQHLAR